MEKNGKFCDLNPQTEWLTDDADGDRKMQLLREFSYRDPAGNDWIAPKDWVIDGASIPRPLWSSVGSPYTDDYRRASIVHDYYCDQANADPTNRDVKRKAADVMFHSACLAGGCSPNQAALLYAGVRIGAWSGTVFTEFALSRENLLFRDTQLPGHAEQSVKEKFDAINVDVAALNLKGSGSDVKLLDRIIERHLVV